MKKLLVLVAVSFFCWLSCKKTDPTTPSVKPCVRVYDTAFTTDSYTELDTFSTLSGVKTLEFKLRLISLKSQTGTCDVVPTCSNLMTITNKTGKTVTIFYNLIGGSNVMISPNAVKDEVVPSGVFATPNGPCISIANLKSSMKVRYN
jgi:hypothetical protein